MLSQTKNYQSISQQYSKDFIPDYSKLKNNLNVSYQESLSNNFKKKSIRIQSFDTKRSKQVPSPTKLRYNLENQSVAQKELYMKNRFDEIRKKYDKVGKRDSYQLETTSPLKQLNKQSYKDISLNKFTNSYLDKNNENSFEKVIPQYKKNIDYRNNYIYDKKLKINQEKSYNKIKEYDQMNSTLKNYDTKPIEKIDEQQRIEKINQKIQKIMKSINQNDNYSNHEKIQSTNLYHNRKISSGQIDIYEKSKSFTKKENLSNNNLIGKTKDFTYNHNKIQKRNLVQNRSTSLLTKPINNSIEKNQFCLRNGRDLDQQINKINQRIKKSEEQKKKLNIKFEGYQQYQIKNKTRGLNNEQSIYVQQRSIEKINFQSRKPSKIDSRIQEPISFKNISETNSSQTKLTKIASYTEKQFRVPKLSIPSFNIKSFHQQQNNKKQQKMAKTQTNRLIECLKKQVEWDQNLRDAKLLFSFNDNADKWRNLKKQIEKFGINLNESELKIQFEITLEEYDPFFSIRQSNQISQVELLAKIYFDALNYFKTNIRNRFNSQILINQNLKEQNLDLQKKGYLTVEDFVRYLNMETGTFYRNRDLVLIFRRFTKENQLKFKQFLQILSQ